LEGFTPPDARQSLIDELLSRHQAGENGALEALWREIYSEVHRLARSILSQEGSRRPIDTTVLVHELYIKMGGASFENRAHLFGSLVRMMGQIITDAARRRSRRLRREEAAAISAEDIALDVAPLGIDMDPEGTAGASAIRALDRLDALAPRPASVAWLRFVGGLSVEQVAACLGISERTVKSDWAFARAWLHRELTSEGLRPRTGRSAGDQHDD
jgi:RNA polymerase sigma factor (TIGR02999 family)